MAHPRPDRCRAVRGSSGRSRRSCCSVTASSTWWRVSRTHSHTCRSGAAVALYSSSSGARPCTVTRGPSHLGQHAGVTRRGDAPGTDGCWRHAAGARGPGRRRLPLMWGWGEVKAWPRGRRLRMADDGPWARQGRLSVSEWARQHELVRSRGRPRGAYRHRRLFTLAVRVRPSWSQPGLACHGGRPLGGAGRSSARGR